MRQIVLRASIVPGGGLRPTPEVRRQKFSRREWPVSGGTTDVGGLRRHNEEFPRADVQSSGSPEARRPERTAAVQRIEPSRSTLLGHTPGVRLASETARPTQEWIRQRNLHNAFLTSAINRSMLAFGLAATLRNHRCPAIVVVDAAPAGSCCNTLSNVSVSLGRQTTIPVCGSA